MPRLQIVPDALIADYGNKTTVEYRRAGILFHREIVNGKVVSISVLKPNDEETVIKSGARQQQEVETGTYARRVSEHDARMRAATRPLEIKVLDISGYPIA